jgi:hypothetical protein
MSNVTYLGRDLIVVEDGKWRVVPDWKLFVSWSSNLEPFEYNQFGFKTFPHVKAVILEDKKEATPFKFDPGVDGQWVDIQEYLTERNEGKVERNIAYDYSYELALKKSTANVGYSVDTIDLTRNTNSNKPTIDIHSLPLVAAEAVGRSGTKNHARRIRVSAGFVTVKKVDVKDDDELIDIIRRLEVEGESYVEETFVKVTNIGTDPYTHKQVRTPSRPIDYDTIRVDGQVIEDARAPLRKFYGQFDMHKHNYVGVVNKKSDGRCNRTGDIGDPKSPKYMQQYRHQPSIIITPNVKIQETTHTVKFTQKGALQQELEIAKVTRGEDCECGCNVKVKDMRRGEVLCPKCGLVFHRDTIVG